MMRVPNSHQDVCTEDSTSASSNDFKQTLSPAKGSAPRDPGKKMFVKQQSHSEGKLEPDVLVASLMNLPSAPVYRSCVHYEVPLRFISSVVCLDKLLSISLLDPGEKEESKTAFFKSTLSLRLGVSSYCRCTDATKTNGVHRAHRAARLATHRERGSGFRCSPVSKQPGSGLVKNVHTNGNKPGGLNTQDHEPTSDLLLFKEPGPWNTKEYRQQGNADEPTFTSQSNFRHRPHTFSVGPDVSRTASKKTDSRIGQSCPQIFRDISNLDETCDFLSPRRDEYPDALSKTLSLKEALELFRPDFISRSQGRVRRLEQRAKRRRALQGSNPDLVQGLGEDQGRLKRNCTMPDPLSDNLFKPRERSISSREMQLRSRRIYNKLPEVMKKREEEKKRTVTQTNRLRAEVFKKRLLDQVLQR